MANNLLESVKSEVGLDLAEHSATFFNEEEPNTRTAVNGTFAAILAGMIQRVSYDKGAKDLHKLLTKENVRDYDIQDIFTRSPQTVNGMVNRGSHFLPSIYPGRFREATNTVADEAKIKKLSSSKMMKVCAPLMLNTLGKHVQTNNLDVNGLKSYLNAQKSSVQSSLPASFFENAELSAFGWTKKEVVKEEPKPKKVKKPKKEKVVEVVEEVKTTKEEVAEVGRAATGGMSILKWLLPLFLILALAWFLISKAGCGAAPERLASTVVAPVEAVSGAVKSTTAAVTNVFGQVDNAAKALLDKVTFATGSAGEQMMSFVKGGGSGEGRFRFNNLTFASGSAAIDGESGLEVDNMSAILKAYPSVKIALEGYTDSQGNPQANETLSQNRADAVKSRLVASGISTDRITVKGFGAANPVADNETPEGRAQNRRIEVVVAK